MSCVTCLIMHVRKPDEERMAQVNEYFQEKGQKGLVSIEDPKLPERWYGGSKFFEAGIWLGAFNYLDLPGFIAHICRLEWRLPSGVQLMVLEQQEISFGLLDVFPEAEKESDEDKLRRAQGTL